MVNDIQNFIEVEVDQEANGEWIAYISSSKYAVYATVVRSPVSETDLMEKVGIEITNAAIKLETYNLEQEDRRE